MRLGISNILTKRHYLRYESFESICRRQIMYMYIVKKKKEKNLVINISFPSHCCPMFRQGLCWKLASGLDRISCGGRWLKEFQESMNITEIVLKTALNTIQSIKYQHFIFSHKIFKCLFIPSGTSVYSYKQQHFRRIQIESTFRRQNEHDLKECFGRVKKICFTCSHNVLERLLYRGR